MIPVVVFWTQYTATVGGRVLKFVPCEGCGTEYVYTLHRDAVGVGTDVYLMNPGAEGHALSAAEDSLRQALENDFDPVPCPACGHYQPYMFPKLLTDRSPWAALAAVAALGTGILGALVAAYWTVAYLGQPTDAALWRMVGAWSVVVVSGLVGAIVASARRAREQRFDPNAGTRTPGLRRAGAEP
jgi:hypothetical protein